MARTIQTNILINARANGLSEIGNTLTELGAMLQGFTEDMANFGRDSLDVYRDYEKSMADAEVALSTTYGRGTRQLKNVMGQLDEAATEWAASTIFHTDDVANAISEAAHAGWDLDQIMSGVPAAMQLAQAGSLDLSEAVNYIVKSTNSLGMEFEDTENFIDLWAYAANSSATNIEEVGEAMLKMGGTMRFADSEEELLTMIATLGDAGTVGSNAGTLLRNSMLRLIAPTKKASDVMASLGVEGSEIAEIMGDTDLAAANATLSMHGFSAYTEDGELKPMMKTFEDLYMALVSINGSTEGLFDNAEVNSILSAIFPTRSITGAIALLNGAADGWDGLYDAMIGGAAKGYGKYAAEVEMDTLFGAQETFISKLERLKQVTGETLAPQMERIYAAVGGLIDALSGMDDTTLTALVGGLEGIAAVSGGLMLAGTALRLIANPFAKYALIAAGIGAVAGAVGALAVHFAELKEAQFEDLFGDMNLDPSAMNSYIESISGTFEEQYKEVRKFHDALVQDFNTFKQTSSEFKSDLTTAMITHAELSPDDQKALLKTGKDIGDALKKGIDDSFSQNVEALIQAYGGDEEQALQDPMFAGLLEKLQSGYDSSIELAKQKSEELRKAMVDAFEDKMLDETELAGIQAIMDQMNTIMAQSFEIENYAESARELRKAQSLGLNYAEEYMSTLADRRAEQVGNYEYVQAQLYKTAEINGATEEELASLREHWVSGRAGIEAAFNQGVIDTFSTMMQDSDIAEQWNGLKEAATLWAGQEGFLSSEDLPNISGELKKAIGLMVDSLGGMESFSAMVDYFEKSGDAENFQKYGMYYNMANLAMGETDYRGQIAFRDTQTGDFVNAVSAALEDAGLTIQQASEIANANVDDRYAGFDVSTWGSLRTIAENSGFGEDVVSLINNALMSMDPYSLNLETEEAEGKIDALSDKTITPSVSGDFTMLDAGINARQNRTITLTLVEGGRSSVSGRAGSAGRGALFAEGGRANTASIFGEAGPEWAIPEEHSQRTAELLDAARAASGFTWPDLLSRLGGLNANANNQGTTLVYSPTINAGNVSGVEAALAADKSRLEKWWEDRRTRDAVEVYA